MDFSFFDLNFNSIKTLPGFETHAVFTVNSAMVFHEYVDTVPRRWLYNLINLVGHRQGVIANSFHAYNYYLLPLVFGLWYLSWSFHGKLEDEPPIPVLTCGVGIPPAAVWSATARRLCCDSSTCSHGSNNSLTNSCRVSAPLSYLSRRFCGRL